MRKTLQTILMCGVAGAVAASVSGGTVTSATAAAFGPGSNQRACDTGFTNQGLAVCSSSAPGNTASAFSASTVDFNTVSAYVYGGAFWSGSGASATANATFTQTYTVFGGTGLGTFTILESTIRQGTGSLASGTTGSARVTTKFVENFIYGTPFTVTLSAFASGNFIGAYCDGGSLMVRKTIDSITFTDRSGVISNVTPSAAAQTLSPTPEPAGWVLALLGAGLVLVARAKLPRRDAGQNQSEANEQGTAPRWSVGDGDLG